MNKKRIINITLEILDVVLGIPEALAGGFERRNINRVFSDAAREKSLSIKNISKFFHNLRQSDYVEVVTRNGTESVRFTNKARLAVVEKVAERMVDTDRYYLISFDIPERLRVNRNQFRRVLKRLGCAQIQKSLWVSRRKIGEIVEIAAQEYKVDDYVVYAVVESINITAKLDEILNNSRIVNSDR